MSAEADGPAKGRRRPVGLAEPDGSAGASFDKKDFDPEEIEGGAPGSLAVVLRRSGDLSEEPRTRSHLELGR